MSASIEYPFTAEKVRALRAGMRVTLSGRIWTARDRAHRLLAAGGPAPADLRDGAIYHCGPVAVRREDRWEILAAGPTTSIRQEPHTPALIRHYGVRAIIGKGGMGDGTRAACRECGCVYLQAVGGAACSIAACVRAVEAVYLLREFGAAEAMWQLVVRDLPLVVAIDAAGRSLFAGVARASKRELRRLMA